MPLWRSRRTGSAGGTWSTATPRISSARSASGGKLVVYGDVGQTFLYGVKGGEIYVLGNAAGRPMINAVGARAVEAAARRAVNGNNRSWHPFLLLFLRRSPR